MSTKKKPGTYFAYSPEILTKAVDAVQSGRFSQRAAAKEFGVAQSTISDRIKKKYSNDKPGRQTVLSTEQENEIVGSVLTASDRGMGLTKSQLLVRVGRVAQRLKGTNTPFKGKAPGEDWYRGFVKRHPEISLRKPEGLSNVRARALNPVVTGNYFLGLHKVLVDSKLTYKPSNIWNMDETGASLEHNPIKVVARKGCKNVPGRASDSRKSVTVTLCVNAAGQAMSPLFIIRGKTLKSLNGWSTHDGPPGSVWTFSERAWTDDIIGKLWFNDVFLKHCGPDRPQLLILDGHHSHETIGLLESALEENIHILCLPPHTTHALQPLDVSINGPLKSAYNKFATVFCHSDPNLKLTKLTWPGLYSKAYAESLSPSNIIAGFRACGIYPWNPLAIKAEKMRPSVPTDFSGAGDHHREAHRLLWVNKQIASSIVAATALESSISAASNGCNNGSSVFVAAGDIETSVTSDHSATYVSDVHASQAFSPDKSSQVLRFDVNMAQPSGNPNHSLDDSLPIGVSSCLPLSSSPYTPTINFAAFAAETPFPQDDLGFPIINVPQQLIDSVPNPANVDVSSTPIEDILSLMSAGAVVPKIDDGNIFLEYSSSSVVAEEFPALPKFPENADKKIGSSKKTGHRLLTSSEIIEVKRTEKDRKEREENEKQDRKEKREAKREENKRKKADLEQNRKLKKKKKELKTAASSSAGAPDEDRHYLDIFGL